MGVAAVLILIVVEDGLVLDFIDAQNAFALS